MARILRLARIALAAEGLRWRLLLRLRVRQGILIAAALIFFLFALALGHVAAFFWLAPHAGVIAAALALAGLDLVVALGLLLAARGNQRLAAEAEALRRAALTELRADAPRLLLDTLLRQWRRTGRR
ncbi:hypothetical protein [Acidiphilium sp.]|uniref:hypothetical protein n=1 Tax=Acidiphilium sp. TaxID=527 RepID=UPI00258E5D5E|nr:hypothetical protein [Acidiphilium sp.]